jgi:carboxymethylenebutenolidase
MSHNAVEPKRVGAVGFCLGGGLALFLASLKPIDAAVSFYGVLMGAQPDLNAVKGAVQGHYADHDDFASPESARALEQQLKDAGKEAEFFIYDNTTHAFAHQLFETDIDAAKTGLPFSYNDEAAKAAWQRTLDFFNKHLR